MDAAPMGCSAARNEHRAVSGAARLFGDGHFFQVSGCE